MNQGTTLCIVRELVHHAESLHGAGLDAPASCGPFGICPSGYPDIFDQHVPRT